MQTLASLTSASSNSGTGSSLVSFGGSSVPPAGVPPGSVIPNKERLPQQLLCAGRMDQGQKKQALVTNDDIMGAEGDTKLLRKEDSS